MSRPSSNDQPLEQCERADGPQTKRKRSTSYCHQCHKNDRGTVMQCNKCNKRYCTPCVNSWYRTIKDALFMEGCPLCLNICNCGACLQSEGPYKIQDLINFHEEKADLLAYTIRVLLPSFKKHIEEAETQDNKVLQLLGRSEAIVNLYDSTDGQRASQISCSCSTCDDGGKNFLKASSREDRTENYLYCPMAADTEKSDPHFLTHFSNGQPVIVRGVQLLTGAFALSWEPTVMERGIRASLRKFSNSMDLSVTNCANWCEEKIKIHEFFEGYSMGLLDYPKVLKLEWPPSKMFQNQLPRHYGELIRCLPFKHYTHPFSDCLNDVSMCVSYGSYGGADQWGSIIKLQYCMSDRVSILMHAASINCSQKGKSPVSSNTGQGVETGAEWDIFRKKDIPKLEDYLSKHAEELWRSVPLQQEVVHPNHQRNVYLTMEHKKKLKDEYGIEPWTFVQKIGDAIFVPAGCWYQMRNLKSCIHVAADFFSPQSLSETGNFFERFRCVPSEDFQKKYKSKVKEVTLYVIGQAVERLEKIQWGSSGKTLVLES